MRRLVTPEGGIVGDGGVWQADQIVVVGREGFEWPSIEVVLGHGGTGEFASRLNETHILRSRFVYNVRKGVPPWQRRQKLARAVTGPGALGLRDVADHIDMNGRRGGERMKGAVERWKDDLEWLRQSYYEGKPHSFVWPGS